VRAQTGWELQVSVDLKITPPPTDAELGTLRSMTTVGT